MVTGEKGTERGKGNESELEVGTGIQFGE